MLDNTINRDSPRGAFREVPYMGVIFVVDEAHKRGFWNGNPEWSNLGQGQPEVGELEGAPARISHVEIAAEDHAYGRKLLFIDTDTYNIPLALNFDREDQL